jgi:hypothetical protein
MLVCACLLGSGWSVHAKPEKLGQYRDTIGVSVCLPEVTLTSQIINSIKKNGKHVVWSVYYCLLLKFWNCGLEPYMICVCVCVCVCVCLVIVFIFAAAPVTVFQCRWSIGTGLIFQPGGFSVCRLDSETRKIEETMVHCPVTPKRRYIYIYKLLICNF